MVQEVTTLPLSAEVAALIAQYALEPHPEGGFYRETYRAPCATGARASSSAIYFLLPQGVINRWHRVDADEVWHFYAGSALELEVVEATGRRLTHVLGMDHGAGQEPQFVVPAGAWQRAKSLGSHTLVGCTVAPAFEFERFEILPEGEAPEDHL